jgi:hypothetical protein
MMPRDIAPGDTVELSFPGREERHYGYYQYYHPTRCKHLVTAKKTGTAGWLVEPEQIVRIVERVGRRHGRRHR